MTSTHALVRARACAAHQSIHETNDGETATRHRGVEGGVADPSNHAVGHDWPVAATVRVVVKAFPRGELALVHIGGARPSRQAASTAAAWTFQHAGRSSDSLACNPCTAWRLGTFQHATGTGRAMSIDTGACILIKEGRRGRARQAGAHTDNYAHPLWGCGGTSSALPISPWSSSPRSAR